MRITHSKTSCSEELSSPQLCPQLMRSSTDWTVNPLPCHSPHQCGASRETDQTISIWDTSSCVAFTAKPSHTHNYHFKTPQSSSLSIICQTSDWMWFNPPTGKLKYYTLAIFDFDRSSRIARKRRTNLIGFAQIVLRSGIRCANSLRIGVWNVATLYEVRFDPRAAGKSQWPRALHNHVNDMVCCVWERCFSVCVWICVNVYIIFECVVYMCVYIHQGKRRGEWEIACERPNGLSESLERV